jgi:hypothetical protein
MDRSDKIITNHCFALQQCVANLLRFLRFVGGGVKVCPVTAGVSRCQDWLTIGSKDIPCFEGEVGEAE